MGISHPMPPPSVKPAIPVLPTTPPVVARPCTWVSRLSSFHKTPPWARAVRARGSTWIPFIGDRSISRPSIERGMPGDVVAAAAHRDVEIKRPCQRDRIDDIGDAVTAGDRGRMLVDQAVVHPPPSVVAGVGGLQRVVR